MEYPTNNLAVIFTFKVWPMNVASTVSRLPVTVKMVPVSSSEEEGGGEQQQQGEREEEGPQQHSSQQTHAEQESAQTGDKNTWKSLSLGL